jgi:hypothetical protein
LYTPYDPEATENKGMISATFIGQAKENIRWKLQKLEGFAGMNGIQLLEVATKVFVNWDQEAKQEANRRMKRKVDLLTAVLAEQSDVPQWANPGRGRGNPWEWWQMPPGCPCPREELGWNQCAYCHQEGQWKNECP